MRYCGESKSKVRFLDFSKEPLGWPPDDSEILVDINTVQTSDLTQRLSAGDSLVSATARKETSNSIRDGLSALDNISPAFPDMPEAPFNSSLSLEGPDVPNTSTSALEAISFPSILLPDSTICRGDPEYDQIQSLNPCFNELPEPKRKRRRLTYHSSPSRLQHDFHLPPSDVMPYVQHQQYVPADMCTLLSSDSIKDVNISDLILRTSDSKSTADCTLTATSSSLPYSPGHLSKTSESAALSASDIFSHSPSTRYTLNDSYQYSDESFQGASQSLEVNPFLALSSLPVNSEYYPDLTSIFGTDISKFSSTLPSWDQNMLQSDSAPFLDLQFPQPEILSSSLSSNPLNMPLAGASSALNDQPIYSPLKITRVLTPILLKPVTRDHSHSTSRSNSTTKRAHHWSSPTSPNPGNDGFRTGYRNLHRDTEDRPFENTSTQASSNAQQSIPLPKDKSVQRRENGKQKTTEDTSGTPIRQKGDSTVRRSSSSPFVDLTGADPHQPIEISAPSTYDSSTEFGNASPDSILPSNGLGYILDIPFITIIPTSEAEVVRPIPGVSFSELKQCIFGLGPVSEFLENPDSRPLFNQSRMTELYVLVEWPFPLGQKENDKEHKIIKADRPINHLRRVEILCKIAKRLYDYIQKEEAVLLDPKKLCIMSLRQQIDKKWRVRIGSNNSQRIQT